jgi:uncharacterized membrane protein
LRFHSAVFGIISILVIYSLGKLFFDKKAGVLGALLLAISPLHIYYSQELRMYSSLVLLILLSLYFLKRFLGNGKFIFLFGYSIFITLSIYTHYIALLTLLGGNVFFLLNFKKYKYLRLKWAKGQLGIVLLLLPIVLLMFSQLKFILKSNFWQWVQPVSWETVPITLKNFSIGYNASYIIFILACSLYFSLFILGIYIGIVNGKEEGLLLLLCYLFIPIFIVFLISIFKPYYVDRYFIPSLPIYLLVIANGLYGFKKKYLLLVIFSILVLTFFALKNYYLNYFPNIHVYQERGVLIKPDTRNVAKYICKNFREGDIICHADNKTVPQILYYLGSRYKSIINEGNGNIIKANKRFILKYDSDAKRASVFEFFREKNSWSRQVNISLDSYKRIWFISFDPQKRFQSTLNWLTKEYKITGHNKFYGVELYLFDCNATR